MFFVSATSPYRVLIQCVHIFCFLLLSTRKASSTLNELVLSYMAGIEVVVERNHALIFNMFFWATPAFLILSLRLCSRAVAIRQIGADGLLARFIVNLTAPLVTVP